MRRPVHLSRDRQDELVVAQQYAKDPTGGLVVKVQQHTTGAGRGILLTPDQVRQLRDDLDGWLTRLTSSGDHTK